MRRFLILGLVLSLASTTHAVPVVQLAADDVTDGIGTGASAQVVTVTGGTLEIGVYSSTADPWKRYVHASDLTIGSFNWNSDPIIDGDEGTVIPVPYYPGWWMLEAKDTTSPFNIAPGKQFYCIYTPSSFNADGSVVQVIDLWNEEWTTVIDTLKIVQLPEPMTIALLGLGGLALLRKRSL